MIGIKVSPRAVRELKAAALRLLCNLVMKAGVSALICRD